MALKDLLFSNVAEIKPSDLLVLIKSNDEKYLAVKLDTESDMEFTEVLTKLETLFPKSKGFTAKGVNVNVLKKVAPDAEIIDFKDLDESKQYFSVNTEESDNANSDKDKAEEPETDNGKSELSLHSLLSDGVEENKKETKLYSNMEDILFSAEELGETPNLKTLLFDDVDSKDDKKSDDEPSLETTMNEFEETPAPTNDNKSKVKIEVEMPEDPASAKKNSALEKVKQIVSTFHSKKFNLDSLKYYYILKTSSRSSFDYTDYFIIRSNAEKWDVGHRIGHSMKDSKGNIRYWEVAAGPFNTEEEAKEYAKKSGYTTFHSNTEAEDGYILANLIESFPNNDSPSSKKSISSKYLEDYKRTIANKAVYYYKKHPEWFENDKIESGNYGLIKYIIENKLFDSLELDNYNAEAILDKIKEVIAGSNEVTEPAPAPLGTTTEIISDTVTDPAPAPTKTEVDEEPEKPEVTIEDEITEEEYKTPVQLVKEANANPGGSLINHCRNQNKK